MLLVYLIFTFFASLLKNNFNLNIYLMAKGMVTKKTVKKEATKTAKEKKEEKRDKKNKPKYES